MRDLKRNQKLIYYALYTGETEIIDDDGNLTGDFKPTYGETKAMFISVSANKGTSETDAFGTNLDYDRTLSTANLSCEIDEHSILWLDGADPTDENSPDPYNFVVVKKATSLNQVLYAIKQVDVVIPVETSVTTPTDDSTLTNNDATTEEQTQTDDTPEEVISNAD